MVWPRTWNICYVAARSRVHCEDRGDVVMDVRFPSGAPSPDYIDPAGADPLREHYSLHNAL